MAKEQAVTKAKDDPRAVAMAYDYGKDAGSGFEGQTSADYSIPFLALLQAQSPQCMDPATSGKARPGYIFNTASGEIYDAGVTIIPCRTDHVFVEWRPRAEGGGGGAGFAGIHTLESPEVEKARAASTAFGKFKLNGNDLVETFYIYGLALSDDEQVAEPVVVAFSSTKIKPYRNIMYRLRSFKGRAPMFAHRIRMKTTLQENKKGKFWNLDLVPLNGDVATSLIPPGSPLLEMARQLVEQLKSGAAKADYAAQASTGHDPAAEATEAEAGDGKAPF